LIQLLFRRLIVIGKNLSKHRREFQGYVDNHKYERTESGVYFPRASAYMSGVYEHWITGQESDVRRDCNVIPLEGQNYMLGVVFKGTPTQTTSFYLGLHSGTGAEDSAVTAATYNATYSEIQAQSGDPGGYTSATRIAWASDAIDTVNTELVNSTTPAAFTISTTTTCVVNGAWMTTQSGRTNYTGYAMSITKFTATRNLANTDVFNLVYTIDLDHV
jgi:hypothetical protein